MSKKIGTHSGSFHADEALACFLLRQTDAFKGAEIVRTRDPAVLEALPIIVDVGGEYDPKRHRYDHHQKGFTETFSPNHHTKLSSAGLVFKHFGEEVISNLLKIKPSDSIVPFLHKRMYQIFVEAFDGIDNGVNQYDTTLPPRYRNGTNLSSRVGRLNPKWNETGIDIQARFEQAVELTGKEFVEHLDDIWTAWLPARQVVERALDKRFELDASGLVIYLDQACPWQEHLFDLESERGLKDDEKILYALFHESGSTGNCRIQAVPVQTGSFESRSSLPKDWCGLRDEELSKASGVPDGIFVHINGFIGGNKSYEGALALAKKAIQLKRGN